MIGGNEMEYRTLPHGGEKISVIGLGAGSLPEDVKKAAEILHTAIQNGINFFDLAPSVHWMQGQDTHADALRCNICRREVRLDQKAG